MTLLHAQDVAEIVDPKYIPRNEDERDLFLKNSLTGPCWWMQARPMSRNMRMISMPSLWSSHQVLPEVHQSLIGHLKPVVLHHIYPSWFWYVERIHIQHHPSLTRPGDLCEKHVHPETDAPEDMLTYKIDAIANMLQAWVHQQKPPSKPVSPAVAFPMVSRGKQSCFHLKHMRFGINRRLLQKCYPICSRETSSKPSQASQHI